MKASLLLYGLLCACVLLPNSAAQSAKKPKTPDQAGEEG
jgi:hypothetical protein